jgi:hypothetical protein
MVSLRFLSCSTLLRSLFFSSLTLAILACSCRILLRCRASVFCSTVKRSRRRTLVTEFFNPLCGVFAVRRLPCCCCSEGGDDDGGTAAEEVGDREEDVFLVVEAEEGDG